MKPWRSNKGFTLFEVLITTGILAWMTSLMSGTMDAVFTNKNVTTARAEIFHGITLALGKVTDDLAMAFHTDATFHGAAKSQATGFAGDVAKLNFSTMSHVHFVKNKKDTDQVVVGYYLEKGEGDLYNLMRSETDTLSSKVTETGRAFILLPNVSSFELEYYDANKKQYVQQWDTDSVSSGGRLPQIVKLKLTVILAPEGVDEEKETEEPETYYFESEIPVRMYEKISF
jgi:hypothetical protein